MKTRIFSTTLAAISAGVTLSAMPVFAQNSASVSTTVTTGRQTAPALPYGAANVLKLTQADVGEETIIAYIEKTGLGYNLGATEIIYLREHGVSDRVITTMLAQEKNSRDTAVAQAATQQTALGTTQVTTPVTPVVAMPQYQQTYTPPPVTYVQTAPAPLIVMRDSSPRLVDYGIYPRYSYGCYPSYNYGYRSYGCYSYPRASFSIGFSGHHGSFGFRSGGYHGGYCR